MITLTPAYGRDYQSAQAVLAAWNSEKDFMIATYNSPDHGRYCSRKDFKETQVKIRYDKLSKCVII